MGENVTIVSDEEGITDLYVQFTESKRIYIVTCDGKITYIGDEEKLSKTAVITADPESNQTPKLSHTVTLTVRTGIIMNEENLRLKYAWSKSATQEPEEFKTAELTGSGRIKKCLVTTVDTEEGDYYLWAKAYLGENMETEINLKKPFGPYKIKDHSTLRYCGNNTVLTSKFLNSDTVIRGKVKNVTLVDSLQGHSLDEANCWDVSQEQKGKILAWYEVDENGYYSVTIGQDGGVTANVDSRCLFCWIGYNVADGTEVKIEGLENLDTSKVTDMSSMFSSCSGLTSLDVSKFDTSEVTNMGSMFNDCNKLTHIDISNFNTSKVTNMGYMFNDCNKLTNIDVSKFNTSNVINMSYMFSRCEKLISLDVSKFDTSNVTNMRCMFGYCKGLSNLEVSNFNTSKVTNMSGMFWGLSNLSILELDNFDTSKVTDMSCMFQYSYGLKVLNISNFDTSNVTDMGIMFEECGRLTNLDVSNFNTSNVTDMHYMFGGCSNLTSLNVSNFNTSKVTNMRYMFTRCQKLTNLDVSNFNTSNVTDMSDMFSGCSGLTSLDVSKFSTSKVKSMYNMFYNCYALTSLNLQNFDMSNVTSYNSMFSSVPKSVAITTNQAAKDWLEEKGFSAWLGNVTIVEKTI